MSEAVSKDDQVRPKDFCPVHRGGTHCWHSLESSSYIGKFEMRTRVGCCHCTARATKIEFYPSEAFDYD